MNDSDRQPDSWLSLLRASGETDLASGMQRLARLAAAAHRQQQAQAVTETARADATEPGAVEPWPQERLR